MLKKKLALLLVMLLVASTFTITFGDVVEEPETIEVQLPEKEVSPGDDEDFDEVDEWALKLYQKMDKKYMLIGIYESGAEVDLEEGLYKVKEMKFDGYYPYGPDAYEFEVYEEDDDLMFMYEDMDEGDVPVFQNVGPFMETEGFWAMPGEWNEEDEAFDVDGDFEKFGKSWGGYFPVEEELTVPLVNGGGMVVGEVEVTTTTATFQIDFEYEPEEGDDLDYQLLEYHMHFFDEDEMDEKPFKEHKENEYSVSLGHFMYKSDGFVGFDEAIEVALDEEMDKEFVAIHGEIGVPAGEDFEFDFDVEFGAIDPEEEEDVDEELPEGIEPVEGDWKEVIPPSERGNKMGHIKKENPDLFELYKELDKKGGTWKKYKIE